MAGGSSKYGISYSLAPSRAPSRRTIIEDLRSASGRTIGAFENHGALRGSSSNGSASHKSIVEEIRSHARAYRAPAIKDSNSSTSSNRKSSSHETASLDRWGYLKYPYRLTDESLLARATGAKPQLKINGGEVWDDFLSMNNYDKRDLKSSRPEMLARATGLMPQAISEKEKERLISTDPYKKPEPESDDGSDTAWSKENRMRYLPHLAHDEIRKR